MDEKALSKYAKAFENNEEAKLLVKKKADFAYKRLANVAKKKRAIMQNTVPRFVEVYSQIQKIELEYKHMTNEIALHSNVQKLSTLNGMAMSIKNDLTDKELICSFVTKGLAN